MTRRDRITTREVGPDLMCYDTDKDEVHILNSTARAIYDMRREGKTGEEITGALRAACHGHEGDQIGADVRACIADLTEKGLVD
jgi:hypothetical protein